MTGQLPFRSRPVSLRDCGFYHALISVLDSVHPLIRGHADTKWVMDRYWYDRLRADMYGSGGDPEPDPGKRVPAQGDMLLGIPVIVRQDGGVPHLENLAYSPDWEPAYTLSPSFPVPAAAGIRQRWEQGPDAYQELFRR